MDLDDDTLEVRGIRFYGYTTIAKYAISVDNMEIAHIAPASDYVAMSMPERQELAYAIIAKDMGDVSYVGMEDYATSKANKGSGSILQVAEFCGGIRYMLYGMGIGVVNYGILQIKKYATGYGGGTDKTPMCLAFKDSFPELYPENAFSGLKQFESPMADLCDAFWMCEILRQHLKFEKFGPEAMDTDKLALLTTTTVAGACSLVDSPLVMKGVPYERKKRKTHKNNKKS